MIFILATTEAHKIPITILSRCQRYDFHRITIDTIAARLTELLEAEGVEAEEKAVRYVAKAGDGSMRDALSLLDQCIAFYLGQTLTYDKVLEVLGAVDTEVFSQLLRKVLSGDVTGSIHILEELITGGRELSQFVGDFTWYMRNLLLVKTSENPEDAIDVSSENLKLLKEESEMTKIKLNWQYAKGELETGTLKMLCIPARGKRIFGEDEMDAELCIKDQWNLSIAKIHLGDVESSNILCEEIARRWNEFEEWHECKENTNDVPKRNTPCLLRVEYKEIATGIVEIGYLTSVWNEYGWTEDYLDNFDKSEFEVTITHWKPINKPKGVEE